MILPEIMVEVFHTDNLLLSNASPDSSKATRLLPAFQVEWENGTHSYLLDYQGDFAVYYNSSEDNYIDNTLSASGHFEFSHRSILDIGVEYFDTHEARGTGFSLGFGDQLEEPDQYHVVSMNSAFSYGAKGAQGRLLFEFDAFARRYDNRLSITRTRELDKQDASFTFFYQVMPKTALLLQYQYENIDYVFSPASGASLDGNKQRYLAGISWDITIITNGSIKLGQVVRDFDDQDYSDFSGESWEVGIKWSPVEYTQFDFSSSSTAEESSGQGNYIVKRVASVGWRQEWSTLFYSDALAVIYYEDFKPGTRRDKNLNLNFTLSYAIKKNWYAGIKYDFLRRNSPNSRYEYDRRIISLTLAALL